MTQEAFGKLIASDQGHVSDLVRGKVRPKLESIIAIEAATKGDVTAHDWLAAAKPSSKPKAKPKRIQMERLKQAVRKVVRG